MNRPDWIRTYTMRSLKTGLIAVMSDDLPGLLVVGHTMEEVEARLPAAISALLDAEEPLQDGGQDG